MIMKMLKLPVMLVVVCVVIMFVLDVMMPGFRAKFQYYSILSLVIFTTALIYSVGQQTLYHSRRKGLRKIVWK